ncbi:kinase-like domain-containing protein [Dichotomocladium elegans]|nr:kinase-like domain-containing protein [Dichotomocladium elegans]
MIETEKYFAVVLEYAPGGELFEHIRARQMLPEEEAQPLFAQLVSSVKYMHQKQIVHRDLKLENLLLDEKKNLLVTDFGFANCIGTDGLMATSCGSPCYAAPELVLNGSRGRYAGPAVDVWSCGVILYAMLCGQLPYGDDPNNPESRNVGRLYRYILMSAEPQFPPHMSPDASDLLRQMLTPDPLQRCTLATVTQHPWLRSQTFLLSKTEDELEREATVPRPVQRASSIIITNGDEHESQLGKTWVDHDEENLFLNGPENATSLPNFRQGLIKSLFLPRTVSQKTIHSLRLRFKDSHRRPPYENVPADSMDEAVALEQYKPLLPPRIRRYSTLGRTTRYQSVPRPPSTPTLPIIETPVSPMSNTKEDRQEHRNKAAETAREKVKQWFKRIIQSEENEEKKSKASAKKHKNASPMIQDATDGGGTQATISSSWLPLSNTSSSPIQSALPVYRGLVDQSALTSCSPMESITKVRQIMIELGIDCKPVSSGFRMTCVRRAKNALVSAQSDGSLKAETEQRDHQQQWHRREPIYGDPGIDKGEQVKFVVEICRLWNVPNLYMVHVRHLQGSDWVFKFIYYKLMGFLGVVGLTARAHTLTHVPDRSALSGLQQR